MKGEGVRGGGEEGGQESERDKEEVSRGELVMTTKHISVECFRMYDH